MRRVGARGPMSAIDDVLVRRDAERARDASARWRAGRPSARQFGAVDDAAVLDEQREVVAAVVAFHPAQRIAVAR